VATIARHAFAMVDRRRRELKGVPATGSYSRLPKPSGADFADEMSR
jgi:hypothetical protein